MENRWVINSSVHDTAVIRHNGNYVKEYPLTQIDPTKQFFNEHALAELLSIVYQKGITDNQRQVREAIGLDLTVFGAQLLKEGN